MPCCPASGRRRSECDLRPALHVPGSSVASLQDAAERQIDSELLNASSQRRQNFDYWYCGDPTLRPVLASDDGVQTRMRFARTRHAGDFRARRRRLGILAHYSMENGTSSFIGRASIHRPARESGGCVATRASAAAACGSIPEPSIRRRAPIAGQPAMSDADPGIAMCKASATGSRPASPAQSRVGNALAIGS